MQAGDVLDGQFLIEGPAGAGGAATVFRGRRGADERVAIKVLRSSRAVDLARFEREASLLAELRHPGIVRFIGHGVVPTGERYLALEWLDGEDLTAALRRRGRLAVGEAVAGIRRAADALAFAHKRGVVHRDIKPSNLFLPGRALDRLKVLDFGIARLTEASVDLTASGIIVGTPGYMAPEQARDTGTLDARVDVFSLGCVLFECLTGRPVFAGKQVLAVLTRVLFEEPPRPGELVADVPVELDALVTRMLSKEPDDRPADGAAVAAELDAVAARLATNPATASAPPIAREQSVVSLVMAHAPAAYQATLGAADDDGALQIPELPAHVEGIALQRLAGGTLAAFAPGAGRPQEQVARVASCALKLRERLPEVPIVIATGRDVVGARAPMGAVVEHAARLLAEATAPEIVIDRASAELLDDRFDVSAVGPHHVLRGRRTAPPAERKKVDPS